MSLIRQLWLAVFTSTLIAFAGSFLLSMLTARHYLEQQLATKNADNAASLALAMSQLPKDPVTIELQLAALTDNGQYASVRLLDPSGGVLSERGSPTPPQNAPVWFASLFPIGSPPGEALVSDGWKQFARIQLVSHSRFAQEELWNGCLRLLAGFAVGGLALGLVGMALLHFIRRPLAAVVDQAEAISRRRFVTIAEPRVPELRSLARAMNAMVERLQTLFAEEAQRLELLWREANFDSLSGLANRSFFMNQLETALNSDDLPSQGQLFILRLADLSGINRRHGRETTDRLLEMTGAALRRLANAHPAAIPGRLNGADFGLLLPGHNDAAPTAEILLATIADIDGAHLGADRLIAHVASGAYRHGESANALLARIDAALAAAEGMSSSAWREVETVGQTAPPVSQTEWKRLLDDALESGQLHLAEFPVADSRQRCLLHRECPLRLRDGEDGEWLNAGAFMPVAVRLAMTSALDLAAVRMALKSLADGQTDLAINLAAESIADASFLRVLENLLAAQAEACPRLWLEVPECGAFRHFDVFRDFCERMRALGCRVGIEHFGRQLSDIGRLHDIGLDYLKVDGSFIRQIDVQPGNQAFLKGLCGIAHNIGLLVIAEDVQTAEALTMLPTLGFDGATGPAVPR